MTTDNSLFLNSALILGLASAGFLITYKITGMLRLWIEKIKVFFEPPRRATVVLVGLMLLYGTTFSYLSLRKYQALNTYMDLGVFSQVLWNTTHGRPFENTVALDKPFNYLGDHFAPVLLLIAPFYGVWPDPRLLLVLQSLSLTLGVLPIFWYACDQLRNPAAALSFSTMYYLFPPIQYVNIFDFHVITLAIPLLGFATYWLLKEEYRRFLLLFAMALLVKEDIAFVSATFGLYIALVQGRKRQGFLMVLCGAVLIALLLKMVIPFFAGGTGYIYLHRYAYLGESLKEIVGTILLHPVDVLKHNLISEKLEFVIQLLLPLGFVPLFGFDLLIISLPILGYLLLSDYPPNYSIEFQYTAPLIPFIFFAAIAGSRRIIRWQRRRQPSLLFSIIAFLLIASITNYFLHAPGPFASKFQDWFYAVTEHTTLGHQLMARIPTEASVMTPERFFAGLSRRRELYWMAQFATPDSRPVDYIFFDSMWPWPYNIPPRYPHRLGPKGELSYPRFETVFELDGYILQKYMGTIPITNQLGANFGNMVELLAYEPSCDGQGLVRPLEPGETLCLVLAWQALRNLQHRYVFFVHLVDSNRTPTHLWAQIDQEVGKGLFPSMLWGEGTIMADDYELKIPWGTPPGEYLLQAGVYGYETGQRLGLLDSRGSPQGTTVTLGSVRVKQATKPLPVESLSIKHQVQKKMVDGLNLLGHDFGFERVRAGDTLSLSLYWQAESVMKNDYLASLQLKGAGNQQWIQSVGGTHPTSHWNQGEVLRDWRDLTLRAGLPPGSYQLLLRVMPLDSQSGGEEILLGNLIIEGRERQFQIPPIQTRLTRRVGKSIQFLGYDLGSRTVPAGAVLHLTLYWQALAEIDTSYTVFTHLLDANNRIWGQKDSIPDGGALPTTGWIRGEVIVDKYDILVDSAAPEGEYRIEIGMYQAMTGQRLPVFDEQGTILGDRILLEKVHVGPE